MALGQNARKLALTAHLTFSVGWLGTVLAFLALAIGGTTSSDRGLVRACALGMALLAAYVIVPLSIVSLVTGLVSALGTRWGLFDHTWVLLKLGLTIFAIAVLLLQLDSIGDLARLATDARLPENLLRDASRRPLVHSAGGALVLLAVQILGVYKPWGRTRFGRRKPGSPARL